MDSSNFPTFPLVLRNKINNWKILRFNKDDWCHQFKSNALKFREGDKTYRQNPYWEKFCSKRELMLKHFFEFSSHAHDKWLYFDYKYVKDILPETSSVCDDINWSDLGLNNFQGIDSTLWIGNEGAHTPCHFDTYGCNFVAQIYGKKLWILLPPGETDILKPTRVPYEESSIYSSLNFYTPTNELLNIREAYKVILSPGEVLFVPRHWWHFVENLDVAISVNLWVPLDIDHESRLEECLVRHFTYNMCQDLTKDEALQILNPNEEKLLTEHCSLAMMQKCIDNCVQFRQQREVKKGANFVFSLHDHDVENVHECDLELFITEKSKKLNYDPVKSIKILEKASNISLVKSLINAYANPSNITVIKEQLLSDFIK